jgi:hypothetical protein
MKKCHCCGEERELDRFPPQDEGNELRDFCYSCLDDLDAMGAFDEEG